MEETYYDMLEEALALAEQGWYVFPTRPTKEPFVRDWPNEATRDPNVILDWWDTWPDANIGVACGKSRLVVLDIDSKPGALEDFEVMISTHAQEDWAETVTADTGGGGVHYFFQAPDGINVSNRAGYLGYRGVDVRGDGGYVVVAPSIHNTGRRYEWREGLDPFHSALAPCPKFLYANVTNAPRTPTKKILSLDLSQTVNEGERNVFLTSQAGLLRSAGMDADSIFTALSKINQLRCHPPVADDEIRIIANAIVKYPPFKNKNDFSGNFEESGGSEHVPQLPVLQDLKSFPRTDTGFANALVFCNLNRIKYDHTSQHWLLWNGQCWQADHKNFIMQRAVDVTNLMRRAAEEDTEDDFKKYVRQRQQLPRLKAGIELAQIHENVGTSSNSWNVQPDLLCVRNGVVDMTTGTLRSGDPDDLISHQVNVDYDPSTECPTWLKFINEIFLGDEEVIEFVHRAVGYSFTGHTREQCIFICIGPGSNGKSVFLDVLRQIAGTNGLTTPFSTFERTSTAMTSAQTNDLAAMVGKRFIIASEVNQGKLLDEGRIKTFTGGEPISARFLFQEYFEFTPVGKLWMGVNHLPGIRDDSDGIWRRIRRINFNAKFEGAKADKSIKQKLMLEQQGILNWIIAGAIKWYEDGLTVPKSISQAVDEYRNINDPLANFIADWCEVGLDKCCKATELLDAYRRYSTMRGGRGGGMMNWNVFHQRVIRDFETYHENGVRFYRGIMPNTQAKANFNPIQFVYVKKGESTPN